MQLMSTTSTAGGVGMPTGDGVTNSPTSPLISATVPRRGAQQRALEARARGIDARLADADLRCGGPAAGLAAVGFAGGPLGELDRHQLALDQAREPVRFLPRDLGRHAGLVAARLRRARVRSTTASSARMSSFQSSSSTWSFSTRSPFFTGSRAICPPAGGASLARWQALTVPARVLVTVSATGPRPTSARSTTIGCVRPTHRAMPTPAATKATSTASARHFMESPALVARRSHCSIRAQRAQFGAMP